MSEFVIAAFYKFTTLTDLLALQASIQALCEENGIKGSILLAAEGINGTISGSRVNIDIVLNTLKQYARMSDLEHKESFAHSQPFKRLKVKLKSEIVTLGIDVDPNQQVGTYVEPEDWNKLINDPDVIVVDTRNSYEYEVGTFQRALNPLTENFGEFPDFVQAQLASHKDKKIAMFCTGGIRCEKATSYMLQQGFENVFHLKGGILRYLEQIPTEKSLWQGDCFVFDERITVDHALHPRDVVFCQHCNRVINQQDEICPDCNLPQ